ncbi:hypothetical protein ACOSQ2_008202 [Xanthoceras sorbifolium]
MGSWKHIISWAFEIGGAGPYCFESAAWERERGGTHWLRRNVRLLRKTVKLVITKASLQSGQQLSSTKCESLS